MSWCLDRDISQRCSEVAQNRTLTAQLADYALALQRLVNAVDLHECGVAAPDGFVVPSSQEGSRHEDCMRLSGRQFKERLAKGIQSYGDVLLKAEKLHKVIPKLYTRIQQRRKSIKWNPCIAPQNVLGYTIAPLHSTESIVEEGVKQAHCSGLYLLPAMQGQVYLFSIRREGERVSTMEIHCSRQGPNARDFRINQNMALGNGVPEQGALDAGEALVALLNNGSVSFDPDPKCQEELGGLSPRDRALIEVGIDFVDHQKMAVLKKMICEFLPKGVALADVIPRREVKGILSTYLVKSGNKAHLES